MTDFEQYGYNLGQLPVRNRYWMITVDFESFDRTNVSMWVPAMRHCADQAKRYGFKFSFFTAMENVMDLKHEAPGEYSDFLESIVLLHQSGVEFHPHAHSVFDPDSGACLLDSDSPLPAGYTKRRCMFYRALYDHKINFGVWMDSVRACYETFLAEAGVPVPDNLAFRAGGWDYGSSPEDLHTYLEALNYAGYRIDSSACSGAFGTPSWRMGAEYQANVFRLGPDLIEVAPNEARNCGMPQHGLPSAFQSRSPGPGVFMNVLHFDHLFHRVRSGECQYFAVTDHDEIRGRISEFFQSMEAWRDSPSLKIATFDDIEFGLPDDATESQHELQSLSNG